MSSISANSCSSISIAMMRILIFTRPELHGLDLTQLVNSINWASILGETAAQLPQLVFFQVNFRWTTPINMAMIFLKPIIMIVIIFPSSQSRGCDSN